MSLSPFLPARNRRPPLTHRRVAWRSRSLRPNQVLGGAESEFRPPLFTGTGVRPVFISVSSTAVVSGESRSRATHLRIYGDATWNASSMTADCPRRVRTVSRGAIACMCNVNTCTGYEKTSQRGIPSFNQGQLLRAVPSVKVFVSVPDPERARARQLRCPTRSTF